MYILLSSASVFVPKRLFLNYCKKIMVFEPLKVYNQRSQQNFIYSGKKKKPNFSKKSIILGFLSEGPYTKKNVPILVKVDNKRTN